MSYDDACFWSLLRAIVAALLAIPAARCLAPLLTTSGRWRIPLAILVLSPLFAPELLVGYGWSSFQLTQLHRPVINHWLYFGLILLKVVPAGAVARICTPPPAISPSALHCNRLLGRRADHRRSLSIRLRGTLLRELPVAGVVFLLVFQEFEIASLMQIPAWTVSLFDSQKKWGLEPAVMFERMLLPIAIELLVLVPLIHFCLAAGRSGRPRWRDMEAAGSRPSVFGLIIAVVGLISLWGIPFGFLANSGLRVVGAFADNRILLKSFLLDLSAGMVLGVGAAVLALSLSRLLLHLIASPVLPERDRVWRRGVRVIVFWASMIPGLAGAIVVCLSVLLAIQLPGLLWLRSTIMPAVFALTLFAVPRAVLIQLLTGNSQRTESGHLADLVTRAPDLSRATHGARLLWATDARWLFLTGCVVFYQAMLNLTAAAVLCPPTVSIFPGSMSVVPLPVRLYNMMHFGRNGPLSMMALLSVLVPGLIMIGLAWLLPVIFVRLKRRLARV